VSELIAGAASGFLMASMFIGAGMLMLFSIVKNPSPAFQSIFQKFSPAGIAMSVVVLAYPTWGIIGAAMGLLYKISIEQTPGGGIGSPNMVFTLGIIVVAVLMAAPFMILLRQVLSGVLAMAAMFVGIFGWFLPYFAR
jgi:hypothetical protein